MMFVATGARPTGKALLKTTKGTLVVVAVALLAFVAFAALIPSSQAKDAQHSYYSAASSTPDRSAAGAPGSSEPQTAAPRMSKKEAL